MNIFNRLFIDTSFIQSLYNHNDQYHELCIQHLSFLKETKKLFITDLVLVEIGDAFSSIKRRKNGEKIIRDFLHSDNLKLLFS